MRNQETARVVDTIEVRLLYPADNQGAQSRSVLAALQKYFAVAASLRCVSATDSGLYTALCLLSDDNQI